eukprot:g2829.t1
MLSSNGPASPGAGGPSPGPASTFRSLPHHSALLGRRRLIQGCRALATSTAATATDRIPTGWKFATAGLGGILGWWCVHPFNTMSIQMNLLGASGKTLPSFPTFASQLVRERGFMALYDGIGAGTTRQIFYATSRLGLFEVIRDLLVNVQSLNGGAAGDVADAKGEVTPAVRLGAGLSSGVLAAIVSCPAEVTLIRMSNDASMPASERRNYKHIGDAAVRILKEEGVLAFWSGVVPFAQRAMVVGACQVGTFDQGKHFYAEKMPNRAPLGSTFNVFCAAMTSGLLYATITMPFESAKNRLANQQPDPKTGKLPYTGTFGTMRAVAAKEGVLALWNGFPAYYLRCGGHTTTMFVFIDLLRSGVVKLV